MIYFICAIKKAPVALWYACWNMFFGIMKKNKYEKNIK